MDSIYFIVLIIAAIISILLIAAIFTIKDNVSKHTDILERQAKILSNLSVMIEYQNEAMTAQLHLLSSIAEKAGVPLTDINEVVKNFGIEFE